MFKSISQTTISELIINEFGEGNLFTKEELWFRFHEKYVYSSRKELENIISNMVKQNIIKNLINSNGKELFFLSASTESESEKKVEKLYLIKGDTNEDTQQNRKALKEIKENELNLRYSDPH